MLVKKTEMDTILLVQNYKMSKVTCPNLVKVTSNFVDFYVDTKT